MRKLLVFFLSLLLALSFGVIAKADGSDSYVKALATWAYKFSNESQVQTFVNATKQAGFNWIFVFSGWAQPDGTYQNAENVGGIYLSTNDSLLAPLVLGFSGDWLLDYAHAQGLKVCAFESVVDMYGLQGKLGFSIKLPCKGPYTYNIVGQYHEEWQTFWSHYVRLLKAKGFDAVMFDEYGSELPYIQGGYIELQKEGYLTIFRDAVTVFPPESVLISVTPRSLFNNTIVDFDACKQLGVRFSPWTVQWADNPTEYPIPEGLGLNSIVWCYPRVSLTQQIGAFTNESEVRLQLSDAISQGATGGVYWVALPGDEGTSYFSAYAQVFNDLLITVEVRDINSDGKIDIFDVASVARSCGLSEGSPGWNSKLDIFKDGRIDTKDVSIIARHFGETT